MPAAWEPPPSTENGSHQRKESTSPTPPWELNNAAQVPYIKPKPSDLSRTERQALPSLRGTRGKHSDEQEQRQRRGRHDSINRKPNSIDKQFKRPSEEASRTPSNSPPLTAIRSTQRAPYDSPPSIAPALRSAPPPPPTVPYETVILPPAPKTAPHRLPSFANDDKPPSLPLNASNSIGGTHSRSGSSQASIVKAMPGTMSARVGEEQNIPVRPHSDHRTQSPETASASASATTSATTTNNLPTDDQSDIPPKLGKRFKSALKGIFKRRTSVGGGGGGNDDDDDPGYEKIGGGKHWTDEDY